MSEIQGIVPPDTAPENAATLPTPPPPDVPSIKTLKSWLPLYLQKADRTVEHLSRVLSTPGGTDSVLMTICYTSLLSSTVLSSISLHQIHKAARQIIEKAISLPPNTTVLIDTSVIPSSRLLISAKRLKTLSALISDFRVFTRLWGLIGIWKWGKRVLETPPADALLRRISYAQVMVNLAFQCIENVTYLSSKGVLGWSAERQSKAWRWSARFWMSHVVMDFVRLYREYNVRKAASKSAGIEKGEFMDQSENEWRAKWRKELVVDLAYAPLTLHWSLENGVVGEFWVGLLGSIAGSTGLRMLWRNTRGT
jgi:hypothetical protein